MNTIWPSLATKFARPSVQLQTVQDLQSVHFLISYQICLPTFFQIFMQQIDMISLYCTIMISCFINNMLGSDQPAPSLNRMWPTPPLTTILNLKNSTMYSNKTAASNSTPWPSGTPSLIRTSTPSLAHWPLARKTTPRKQKRPYFIVIL